MFDVRNNLKLSLPLLAMLKRVMYSIVCVSHFVISITQKVWKETFNE